MITALEFKVMATKKSKVAKNPPMPFTTSTLKQDAANKFHFTSSYTMKVRHLICFFLEDLLVFSELLMTEICLESKRRKAVRFYIIISHGLVSNEHT